MRNFFRDKHIEIVATFLMVLYVSGMTGPSVVYIAHDLHHLLTHTLYQHLYHEYAHLRGIHHHHPSHHHGHAHNRIIDFALHHMEENHDAHNGEKPNEAPPTVFKYPDHLQGQHIGNLKRTITKTAFHNTSFSCADLTDKEPDLPPPKKIS